MSVSRLFLDVPITLQFDQASFDAYVGFDLGIKMSSSCSVSGINGSCSITDEKSMVLQPTLGANFALSLEWKIGFFYELETEYSKNWKQSANGVKAKYSF